MTKYSFNQAVPFEATHVGEVIKDELAARNMKQSELSKLTGIQKSNLNDVIKGKRALTPKMALLIGNALGISAEFLINIQTQYDLYVAKQSERVVLQTKMLEILRQDSCSRPKYETATGSSTEHQWRFRFKYKAPVLLPTADASRPCLSPSARCRSRPPADAHVAITLLFRIYVTRISTLATPVFASVFLLSMHQLKLGNFSITFYIS